MNKIAVFAIALLLFLSGCSTAENNFLINPVGFFFELPDVDNSPDPNNLLMVDGNSIDANTTIDEDTTFLHDLNASGGEIYGDRVIIEFGRASKSIRLEKEKEQEIYFADWGEKQYITTHMIELNADRGIPMPRAGSLVGASWAAKTTTVTGGDPKMLARIMLNNGKVYETPVVATPLDTTWYYGYSTQARGIDKFEAGDYFGFKIRYLDVNFTGATGTIEVVFDN